MVPTSRLENLCGKKWSMKSPSLIRNRLSHSKKGNTFHPWEHCLQTFSKGTVHQNQLYRRIIPGSFNRSMKRSALLRKDTLLLTERIIHYIEPHQRFQAKCQRKHLCRNRSRKIRLYKKQFTLSRITNYKKHE